MRKDKEQADMAYKNSPYVKQRHEEQKRFTDRTRPVKLKLSEDTFELGRNMIDTVPTSISQVNEEKRTIIVPYTLLKSIVELNKTLRKLLDEIDGALQENEELYGVPLV